MAKKENYKILQVATILIEKYNFKRVQFSGFNDVHKSELWLSNDQDFYFQLIRVTTDSAAEYEADKQRINAAIEAVNKKDNRYYRFLDIHISNDKYDILLEDYNYLNLEDGYADGYNVFGFYPEIYNVVKTSDDSKKELSNIINNVVKIRKQKELQKPFFKRSYPFVTIGFIIVCLIVYIIEVILKSKYDESAVLVLLGAEYKTFTVGLKQYYRLITCAFLHGSILHLLSNMYSLYYIGYSMEKLVGRKRYAFLTFMCILISSLSSSLLTDNTILIGFSGAIYGMFVYLVITLWKEKLINFKTLIPVIIINLLLNFLSKTAWIAHLGGAVGGVILYEIFSKENKLPAILMLIVVLTFMIYRFVTIDQINPFYQATDVEVANIMNRLGFKNASLRLIERLIQVYSKYGG